jgi:hypothetical protein
MVTTELVQDGARRDRIGRRHLPTERRLALLAQFRGSGLTREAFARQEGGIWGQAPQNAIAGAGCSRYFTERASG